MTQQFFEVFTIRPHLATAATARVLLQVIVTQIADLEKEPRTAGVEAHIAQLRADAEAVLGIARRAGAGSDLEYTEIDVEDLGAALGAALKDTGIFSH